MKKEIKDYTGLSLKIIGISVFALIIFMVVGSIIWNTYSLSFQIFKLLVLGSTWVVVLSLLYFFISVIYSQFRDKRILWGVIDIILLITFLYLKGEKSDYAMLVFVILLISCCKYYFSYIKLKFRKKK